MTTREQLERFEDRTQIGEEESLFRGMDEPSAKNNGFFVTSRSTFFNKIERLTENREIKDRE